MRFTDFDSALSPQVDALVEISGKSRKYFVEKYKAELQIPTPRDEKTFLEQVYHYYYVTEEVRKMDEGISKKYVLCAPLVPHA